MALDDSGISLASSDPNPTIDQIDDGGGAAQWSSVAGAVGQWGTELASVITGQPVAYAPAPGARGLPIPIGAPGSYVGNSPPMSSTTKLLIAALLLGGLIVVIHSMK